MSYDSTNGSTGSYQYEPYGQQSASYDANSYGSGYGGNGGYSEPSASYPYGQQSASYQEPSYGNTNGSYQGGYDAYAQNPYSGQAGGMQAYNPYAVTTVPDHPQSTMVLILGIIGIVLFQPCAPFAWYFGNKARKEIRENPGRYGSSGTLTAGWVMGIIGTVLLGIDVILIIIYVIIIIAAIASQQ